MLYKSYCQVSLGKSLPCICVNTCFPAQQNSALQTSLHYRRSAQSTPHTATLPRLCLLAGAAEHQHTFLQTPLRSKTARSPARQRHALRSRTILQTVFNLNKAPSQNDSSLPRKTGRILEAESSQLRSGCNTTFMVKNKTAFMLTGSTTKPNPFSIRDGAAAHSSRL